MLMAAAGVVWMWTLLAHPQQAYMFAVGLGIFIMGAWGQNATQRAAGLRVLRIGLIMFIIFGAFFELIFTAGKPFGLRSIVFPVALILLGLYLVLARSGLLPGSTKAIDSESTENSLEE